MKYDVVIAGGGPAGCAAALTLARAGLSTVVFEKSDYRVPRVGETLPPAVKAPLARMGLWETFLRDSHSRSPAIHSAWGSAALHEQNHFFNPHGAGWHVDRLRFDTMLALAAEQAGATVETQAAVIVCQVDPSGGWTMQVRSGAATRKVRARFIIDATGRSALIARRLGARRIMCDKLVGRIGFFSASVNSADRGTLVEAGDQGWWYSAVLPDCRLVAAHMTDADLHARGAMHSTSCWLQELNRTVHTRHRRQALNLESGPLVLAANSSRIDRFHGPGWLALGDAAIAFDPISGQGVFRALESGMRGADAVSAWLKGEPDWLETFSGMLDDVFRHYLLLRHAFYCRERRWPDSVFWRRRCAE